MFEIKDGKRIIVSFSNYSDDEEENKKHRNELATSVCKIINSYEECINLNSNKKIILDNLVESDLLGFYEINKALLKK